MNRIMKECYGNFLTSICTKNGGHHKCPHYDKGNGNCFAETSKKGPCDCEFKQYCHIPRQETRMLFEKVKEECDFYKMFTEDK